MKVEAAVFSVSKLNEIIKERLESDPRLLACTVTGEISNFKHHGSGHMYFTLKDDKSRIRAVMFASRNKSVAFRPEDGMRVICSGSIGVFDRDGQYQLYVDAMQPDGVGALYVAFEQLRTRLAAEGLFAPERKRPLPVYPRRIGVVTSPTGAVIRDICTTLERRYPLAKVFLAPAQVQGSTAAATIVAAIRQLETLVPPIDVMIVGRGGGSLEELWPFNEEVVARAVAACSVPIVSAVGHETDFTICDYVADIRAATPTAAAEVVAPHVQDILYQVNQAESRSRNALGWVLGNARQRLAAAQKSTALTKPERMIDHRRQSIDYIEGQLRERVLRPVRKMERQLENASSRLYRLDLRGRIAASKHQLATFSTHMHNTIRKRISEDNWQLDRYIVSLEALNPLAVLKRGFSIVYGEDGTSVLQSVSQVKPDDQIFVHFADGLIQAKILGEKGKPHVGEQTRLDI